MIGLTPGATGGCEQSDGLEAKLDTFVSRQRPQQAGIAPSGRREQVDPG